MLLNFRFFAVAVFVVLLGIFDDSGFFCMFVLRVVVLFSGSLSMRVSY